MIAAVLGEEEREEIPLLPQVLARRDVQSGQHLLRHVADPADFADGQGTDEIHHVLSVAA